MLVNQHTKIAALLKQHPKALETIVSINPKFEKLRNPLLRKLMAGRVSIGMAAKIAGCGEEHFFHALKPLGFETVDEGSPKGTETNETPPFLQSLNAGQIVSLDVRPLLEAGNDPLKQILAKVKDLKQGEVLKITNTFVPTPLIFMLKKKGFKTFTNTTNDQLVESWFFRETEEVIGETPASEYSNEDWEQLMERFAGKLLEIDVRELEMPQPMMRILESLENLPADKALYVLHKRIPVFLLPELAQRGFDYRSRQLSDNEVHLLIFRH